MTEKRESKITLIAETPVEIDSGLKLPAGEYPAMRRQLGRKVLGGSTSWEDPEYWMDLSEADIRRFGGKPHSNLTSYQVDVTNFVRLGELRIAT
jgi:hypothetical protein